MKKYWILIVIALLLIVGFVPFIKTGKTICPIRPPCYESKISIVDWIRYKDNLSDTNSVSVNLILNEFVDITSWKISGLSEWRAITLDPSSLAKYSKGNITVISKVFNEPEESSGPESLDKARRDEDQLIEAVKNRFNKNGWKLIVGPTELGFYQDYLYEKDGKPLVFSTGKRDAVVGGMYVSIQFLKQ
ncbi:MAG: hypothetical protein AAB392_03035 [Patescibacteria group bacterium]